MHSPDACVARFRRRRAARQPRDPIGATGFALSASELAAVAPVSALLRECPGWMIARQGAGREPDSKRPRAAGRGPGGGTQPFFASCCCSVNSRFSSRSRVSTTDDW